MLPSQACAPSESNALNTEPEAVTPDVSSLLTQARASHHAYRTIANDKARYRDLASQDQHIQTALDLRQQAHALDPDHVDAAWLEDQAAMKGLPTKALEAFYVMTLAQG